MQTLQTYRDNGYNDLANLEQHKEVIKKLYEFEISFSDLMELDYDLLKSLLENLDIDLINKFWEEIQNFKMKNSNGNNFQDIVNSLKSIHLEIEDIKQLDDDSIRIILIEESRFPEDRVKDFINSIRKDNNESDESISNYFHSYKIHEEFSPLINSIRNKIKSFDDLLAMEKIELNKLLNTIVADNSLKIKFLGIMEIEKFFKIHNFTNNIFENIKYMFIMKKVSFDELLIHSNDENLELFLFLLITDLIDILPKQFIEFILKNKFNISKLVKLNDEEFYKLGIEAQNFKLLRNALEIYSNCMMRKVKIHDLGYFFISYVTRNCTSIEVIDNFKDSEYDNIPYIKDKEKIVKLLQNKSEAENFLCEEQISIEENILKKIKYINIEKLKELDLNAFIKKFGGKNFNTYKEIINKIKTYNPMQNLELNEEIKELENKIIASINPNKSQNLEKEDPLICSKKNCINLENKEDIKNNKKVDVNDLNIMNFKKENKNEKQMDNNPNRKDLSQNSINQGLKNNEFQDINNISTECRLTENNDSLIDCKKNLNKENVSKNDLPNPDYQTNTENFQRNKIINFQDIVNHHNMKTNFNDSNSDEILSTTNCLLNKQKSFYDINCDNMSQQKREREYLDIKEKKKFEVKENKEDYELKLSTFLNNMNIDHSEINNIFIKYSDNYPEPAIKFYKINRENIREKVDFYIKEEYLYNLIDSIKIHIFDQLNQAEQSLKGKIEKLFYNLKNDREIFIELLLNSFSNLRSMNILANILTQLEENIPILFDKMFPPYFHLFIKYRNDPKIFENLLLMSKELNEIKNEQEFIFKIRKSIQNLASKGQSHLKEIFDEFPELENYIYFNLDEVNLVENDPLTDLLKKYKEYIGPSYLSEFLKKFPYSSNHSISAIQGFNPNSLEETIKEMRNKCGEFFLNKIFERFPDIVFPIENISVYPIENLLKKFDDEIDPILLEIFIQKYPQLNKLYPQRNRNFSSENITSLFKKLNDEVGYQFLEKIITENPELKDLITRVNPNLIAKEIFEQMQFLLEFYVDGLDEDQFYSINDNYKEQHEKIRIFMNIKQKITNKLLIRNNIVSQISEIISSYQTFTNNINNKRNSKIQLEEQLYKLINNKSEMKNCEDDISISEERLKNFLKHNIQSMMDLIKNLFGILKILESINDNIVSELYQIFPDMNKIISPPKNHESLLKEEKKEIEKLLKNHKKSSLSISDLLEIDYNNDNSILIESIIERIKGKTSIYDLIIILFFDCIKRREIFSENLRLIEKKVDKFLINSSNLLEKLLSESTTDLKIMILHICSKYMPIPFLFKDYTFEKNENIAPTEKYKLFPELVFILDDNSSNLLSFCLSDNKFNYVKGKSHFLNYCFGKNFLTYENLRSKTMIEFQFDFNYSQPMKFNIADYHGVADKDIIFKLIPFFNYFILHVKEDEYLIKKDLISSIIDIVQQNHIKEFKIIILLHQDGFNKIERKINENDNIILLKINSIRQMYERDLKNLNDEIWKTVIVKNTKESPFYLLNSVKNRYIYITKFFIKCMMNYEEKLKNIRNFIDHIEKYKENFLDENFLPFHQTFANFSEKNKEFNAIYNDCNENFNKKKKKELGVLYDKIKIQKKSKIVDLFHNLTYDSLFLGNLIDSSSRVKYLIECNLSDLYKERNKIIEEISKNQDENLKEKNEKKKKEILEKINKKNFSYELIVRELYHIQKNKSNNIQPSEKSYFEQTTNQLMKCGQPFEIVDGDNLHFISDFYNVLLRNEDSNVLIVSIIGPQSSGKSTLLNFLFGTQFASSAGRCTKGMYGAIMDIKNHPKYQKILLLDTEGILSVERNDHLFDKKLILFCLCVSHVTILCNKGDIHKGMTDILKLTKECMKELKEQKFIDPVIFVVLNALTDINDKLVIPFQNLNLKLTDIKKLPFAYEMKDVYSDIKINVPSTSFCKKCTDFRNEILNQRIDQKENLNEYTLSEWFRFAQSLWEKIDKFKNLINYVNLEELLQDKQLQKVMEDLIDQFKIEMGDKNDEKLRINKIIEDFTRNFELESFKHISKDIIDKINSETYAINQDLLKKFEKECVERNISLELMNKRKILMEKNLNMIIEDLKTYTSRILEEKKVKYSKAGDRERNDFIDKLCKDNNYQNYSKEEAEKKFEEYWQNNIIKPIINGITKLDQRKEERYNYVVKNYEFCTMNKLTDHNLESELKKYFDSNDEEIILKVFENKDNLYFKEDSVPDIQELFKLNNKKGTFINIHKNLFELKDEYLICKIDLEKGFNKKYFIDKVLAEGYEIREKSFRNMRELFFGRFFEESLEKIFNELDIECKKIGIEFDNDRNLWNKWAKTLSESNEKDIKCKSDKYLRNEAESLAKKITQFGLKKYSNLNYKAENHFNYFNEDLQIIVREDMNYYNNVRHMGNWFLLSDEKYYKVNKLLNEEETNFLGWFIDPENPRHKMIHNRKTGIKFIQSFFDWKKILSEICLIVYKSIHTNVNLKSLEFIDIIKKIKKAYVENENIDSIIKDFSDLSSRNFIDMKNKIESLIEEINREIKAFRFEINQQSIGMFHETAIVLFWTLHTHIEHYKAYETIRINNKNKEEVKNLFISTLTKDKSSIDKNSSNLMIKDTFTSIYENLLIEFKKRFENNMKKNEKEFQPDKLMNEIDQKIKTINDIEKILDYMLRPKEKIYEIFELKWNEKYQKEIKILQNLWNKEFEDKLNSLEIFFKQAFDKMGNFGLLKQSTSLFILTHGENLDSFSIEKNEKFFEKLIGKYLHDSIEGTWSNKIHSVNENLKVKQIRDFPPLDKIHDEFLKNLLLEKFKNHSILNIEIFLKEVLILVDKERIDFKSKFPKNDLDVNTKKKFEQNFIGCNSLCPMCGRKCDVNHLDGVNSKHKCSTGHQFKVFGGSKLENNEPSFITCDSMKDEEVIIFEGQTMKWLDLRLKFSGWDFISDRDVSLNLEKNKELWKIMGKKVCNYYTRTGNTIIYCDWKPREKQRIMNVSVILVLDSSGSMGGQRWNDLIKAVTETLKTINDNANLKKTTKITIITYNSNANLCFEKETVDMNLVSRIQYIDGGTNFEEPMKLCYECVKNSQTEFDSFTIGFMSDGEASYPENTIKNINSDPLRNKIKFNSILFGDNQAGKEVLSKMATSLGGKLTSVLNFEELKSSFIEIVNHGFK